MPVYDIEFKKNAFNEIYYPLLDDDTRTQILFGGSSSGKSVFAAQRCIYDLLTGGRNYLCCRNVGKTIRTSIFNELKKLIIENGLSKLFDINKSEMSVTCRNGYQALMTGLDDVEKVKSVTPARGVITDVWVEEATECQENDIRQLTKRLRGKSDYKKRMVFTFNPILKSHWIYGRFFKDFNDGDTEYRDKDLYILKTIYKDNVFLEPDDIKALEDETDEYFYNVYTLGDWGVLGNQIFTNWRVEDIRGSEVYKTFDMFKHGLDFGFSNDPTMYVKLYYQRSRKRLYIVDEYRDIGITNDQIAEALKPYLDGDYVICDSAEPKSIQELNDHGVSAIGARKGKGSVLHGIQWLRQQEIIIDRMCQHTKNEFELYHWKKDKDGNALNVPIDKFNHSIDCFVGETLVTTRRGDIRIDSLLDDDEVLTRYGYKKMLWHGKTKTAKTSRVKFSDGSEVEGINTHRFITLENIKKPLRSLMQCDILLKNKGGILQWLVNQLSTAVINIGVVKRADIIGGKIKGKLFICTGIFMRMLLVKFLRVMKYTILMVIHWIMPLKTLSFCPNSNMLLSTGENVQRHRKQTWTGLDHLQMNGTKAMRAGHGILNTPKKYIRKENRLKKYVLSVRNHLKIFQEDRTQDFAQTNANRDIGEHLVWTMKRGFVLFVEKFLYATNMRLLKHVHAVAVTDTGAEKDVYNLQVDDPDVHEYFANGLLVGNCIRYALEDESGDYNKIFVA